MAEGLEPFEGTIGSTVAESTPWWPPSPTPTPGSPNVVIVVFDDVGFADFGCFGSDIATPTIDGLAGRGLRYNNFHTTALCSPTRASLLTGRNHHSVGMGVVSNWDTGFPGYRGRVSPTAGTLAEILRGEGYGTFAVGKWHLVPPEETSAAGPYDHWPLQRGFDRFYGFLDGATNHWSPELIVDNHPVDPPARPGYHLTEDLIDQSIELLRGQQSAHPEKPFLLYLCMGVGHYPLHAPRPFVDQYRGAFDGGWDEARERRLARQVELGLVPPGTRLAPRNPGVPPWDELAADEKRVCARLQEAYAGMLDHADTQLARLFGFLDSVDRLDDTLTIVLSDNGASGEGGRLGSLNYVRYLNGLPDDDPADTVAQLDEIGGPTTNPMYPAGWAQVGNTPFKRYKQNTHAGGIRDPLVVSWPRRIRDGGAIRSEYHHAADLVPTILELTDVRPPEEINGVPQQPLEGTSLAYTLDGPSPRSRKPVQYYEMLGNRAIWRDGWKAVTYHAPGSDFAADKWELYHTDDDVSEIDDLADAQPEKVAELEAEWWREAERYHVLPLDDRILERFRHTRPSPLTSRRQFVYYPGPRIPAQAAADTKNTSYTITAFVERPDRDAEGVLISCGDRFGGFVLYVKDDRLVHDYNTAGVHHLIESDGAVPTGRCVLRYSFTKTGELAGDGVLYVGDDEVGRGSLDRTLGVSLGTAGVAVGRSPLTPVGLGYDGPFPFTGTIEKVVIDLGDDGATVGTDILD